MSEIRTGDHDAEKRSTQVSGRRLLVPIEAGGATAYVEVAAEVAMLDERGTIRPVSLVGRARGLAEACDFARGTIRTFGESRTPSGLAILR